MFVKVVCEGLAESWLSMLEVTDDTTVIVGLVRSVKVVAVPGGVRAPLSAEGGAGSDVPSALSTPPFSCRKRFLLNLALAFWNQTCKPIPIDFFTNVSFFPLSFLLLPISVCILKDGGFLVLPFSSFPHCTDHTYYYIIWGLFQ